MSLTDPVQAVEPHGDARYTPDKLDALENDVFVLLGGEEERAKLERAVNRAAAAGQVWREPLPGTLEAKRLTQWRNEIERRLRDELRQAPREINAKYLNPLALRLFRTHPQSEWPRLERALIEDCDVNGYNARHHAGSALATINSARRKAIEDGPAWPGERDWRIQSNVRLRAAGEPVEPIPDNAPEHDSIPALYADVAAYLSGEAPRAPVPTVLRRPDGHALFYSGQVNALFGDPESGKTFVAQAAGVETLCMGGRFLFIDMDHNTLSAVVSRLLLLGAPRELLADVDRFRYCSPDDSATLARVVDDCAQWRPDVVVVDSLGELLPVVGADSDSADDFTRAHTRVLKPLMACGAAVVTIDHLAKAANSRVHGPGGTMAKRRVLGGASLRVKVIRPFTPGAGGAAVLLLNKDRHGGVREHCPAGEREPLAGTFVLDPPSADGVCGWRVMTPLELTGSHSSWDDKAREYLSVVREAAPSVVTAKDVAAALCGEEPTGNQVEQARHWLGRLTDAGQIEVVREGGRGRGPTTWQLAVVPPFVSNQTGNQTALFGDQIRRNQMKSDE